MAAPKMQDLHATDIGFAPRRNPYHGPNHSGISYASKTTAAASSVWTASSGELVPKSGHSTRAAKVKRQWAFLGAGVAVVLVVLGIVLGVMFGVVIPRRNRVSSTSGGSMSPSPDNLRASRGGKLGYDSLVVFGASYCDNAHPRASQFSDSLRPSPYFGGRYSNGPVWDEVLAQNLGPAGTAAPLINYAFGGATIDNTASPKSVPDLKQQSTTFFAELAANASAASDTTPDPKVLVAVWIGLNSVTDIWDTVLKVQTKASSNAESTAAMDSGIASIKGTVQSLLAVVQNITTSDSFGSTSPDILLLPLPPSEILLSNIATVKSDTGSLSTLKTLSDAFNTQLMDGFTALNERRSDDERMYTFDIPSLWRGMVGDPKGNGLGVGDRACLANGTTCEDPDSFLFWDTLHPTAAVHSKLAGLLSGVIKAA